MTSLPPSRIKDHGHNEVSDKAQRKVNHAPRPDCQIHLRHDQKSELYQKVPSRHVTMFAPHWVQEALQIMGPTLTGVPFKVLGHDKHVLDKFVLHNPISLIELWKITRNEPYNCSGEIPFDYYPAIPREVVLSLKDLIRQCVTVGIDMTTAYGGYNSRRVKQKAKVYICDLAGLQFQRPENSGRLVLVGNDSNPVPRGQLDDFIFRQVVGEDRKTYQEVLKNPSSRYVPYYHRSRSDPVFLDTHAYRKFVANDVVLCGLALQAMAVQQSSSRREAADLKGPSQKSLEPDKGPPSSHSRDSGIPSTTEDVKCAGATAPQKNLCTSKSKGNSDDHFLCWKFLKYGTGFFAGPFSATVNEDILPAVISGLEVLFKKHRPANIKVVEFPFYQCTNYDRIRLETLKKKYGLQYVFSKDDALKETPGLITATTNCADPHAATGNEMGYSSVDAAIATNLKSKGNIFSPLLNPKMSNKYLTVQL